MEKEAAFETKTENRGHFPLDSGALDSPNSRAQPTQPCWPRIVVTDCQGRLKCCRVPIGLHDRHQLPLVH